jgi:LemA protein
MTPTLLAVAVFGAVLLFWVIGAYNRLVALRNEIGSAWTRLHETLQQRGALLQPLVATLREPMAAEHGALDTWLGTHAEATKAAAAMAVRPVNAEQAQAWVAAEAALAAAASRVLALLEQHAELLASEAIAAPLAGWRDAQARLPFARQFFNDAARAYNEAAGLFPTRLVARGFGLSPAGLL